MTAVQRMACAFLAAPTVFAASGCSGRASDPPVLGESTAQIPVGHPDHWTWARQRAAWAGSNAAIHVAPETLAIVEQGRVRTEKGHLIPNAEGIPLAVLGTNESNRVARLDTGQTFALDLEPPRAGPSPPGLPDDYRTEIWRAAAASPRVLRVTNGGAWSVLHVHDASKGLAFEHVFRAGSSDQFVQVLDAAISPDGRLVGLVLEQAGAKARVEAYGVEERKRAWSTELGWRNRGLEAIVTFTPDGQTVVLAEAGHIHHLGATDGQFRRSFDVEVPSGASSGYRGVTGSLLWFFWFLPPSSRNDAMRGLAGIGDPTTFICNLHVYDLAGGKNVRSTTGYPAGFGPRWSRMLRECTVRAVVGLPDGSVQAILQEPDASARLVHVARLP